MFDSDSGLDLAQRQRVSASLNQALADLLDFHGRVKTAHWNLRGPLFLPLHGYFDQLAGRVAAAADDLAERAMSLGATTDGTAAAVGRASQLDPFVATTPRDLALAREVHRALGALLGSLRHSRTTADRDGDTDSVDMLTELVTDLEKQAWFLRATLDA